MSLLRRLSQAWQGLRASPSSWDDFWYGPVAGNTRAGVAVNETLAANCTALMACVRLVSGTLAALPASVRRRVDERRSRPESGHPLTRILHDQANDYLGADEFRDLMGHHVELRGNAFAQKLYNRRGQVDALVPLAPDRMTVAVDSTSGAVRYLYRDLGGKPVPFTADELFHLRGPSSDGIVGYSRVALHREAIGMTMAAEGYGAAHFGNGAQAPIAIKFPGKFKDQAAAESFMKIWNAAHKGVDNAGKAALLEQGADIAKIGVTPEESQYLGTRSFQLGEMGRIVGYIPPHLIGDVERSTSWGTGIEAQNIAFLQFGLLPRIRRWELAAWRQLLDEREQASLYVRFNVEGLLRGDSAARASFYNVMRRLSVFTADDILELEDRNPREKGGDTYWEPLDMRIVDADGRLVYEPARAGTRPADTRQAFAAMFESALARCYRRAAQDWRADSDPVEWRAAAVAYQDSQLAPMLAAAHAAGLELRPSAVGYLSPAMMGNGGPDIAAMARDATRSLLGD